VLDEKIRATAFPSQRERQPLIDSPDEGRGRWGLVAATAVVLLVATVLAGVRLGAPSYLGDEAIYASAARNAAVHGQWYPIHLREGLYNSKPPLVIWIPAASFRLFGWNEWADRLPSAVAGVAAAVLVAFFAAWLLRPWVGAIAGLLLATTSSWLFSHGVREGVGDSALTLLTMAALLCYLHYRTVRRRSWIIAAASAVGLGTLLKGLVAPLLFVVTAVAWEALLSRDSRRRVGEAEAAGDPWSAHLGLPLVVAAPALALYGIWAVDTGYRTSDFGANFINQNVVRVFEGIAAAHLHGWTFYLSTLWDAFGVWWILLPWVGAALWRMRQARTPQGRAMLLVGVWAVVPLLVLSIGASKLPWYVDPILPAWAVLLAIGCWELVRWLKPRRSVVVCLMLLIFAGLARRTWAAWSEIPRPKGPSALSRIERTCRLKSCRVLLDGMKVSDFRLREWDYAYLEALEGAVRPLPESYAPGPCDFVVTFRKRKRELEPAYAAADWYETAQRSEKGPLLRIADLCGGALLPALK
jgi:4-amino-4-deoxy-L-arabinose transferase-like glycosyltransferase